MTSKMRGRHVLKRQINGVGAYAGGTAVVLFESTDGDDRVAWDESAAGAEFQTRLRPREVAAALDGVRMGLALARQVRPQATRWSVLVTDLEINDVDTEPTAVEAALCGAALDALGLLDEFRLTYDGGWRWVPR